MATMTTMTTLKKAMTMKMKMTMMMMMNMNLIGWHFDSCDCVLFIVFGFLKKNANFSRMANSFKRVHLYLNRLELLTMLVLVAHCLLLPCCPGAGVEASVASVACGDHLGWAAFSAFACWGVRPNPLLRK